MTPANGVETKKQGSSSSATSSLLSTNTHSSVERTHSCEMEEEYGKKAQAGRTQSYGFEQALQQSQSPGKHAYVDTRRAWAGGSIP